MFEQFFVRTGRNDEAVVVLKSHNRLGERPKISFQRARDSFALPFETIVEIELVKINFPTIEKIVDFWGDTDDAIESLLLETSFLKRSDALWNEEETRLIQNILLRLYRRALQRVRLQRQKVDHYFFIHFFLRHFFQFHFAT